MVFLIVEFIFNVTFKVYSVNEVKLALYYIVRFEKFRTDILTFAFTECFTHFYF